MKIAILGASGYIGRNLIPRILDETDHEIVALARHVKDMPISSDRLSKIDCDVFNTAELHEAIKDCDILYYLIPMMAQKEQEFDKAESLAAQSLVDASKDTKLKQIIYMGGLGDDNDDLSKHLASRHHTGQILLSGTVPVLEFRASMIIGSGSISYDIITNLVHKLPVLTLPTWSKTLTQPIALKDAISYLIAGANMPTKTNEIVEIGGPEQLSYRKVMKRYSSWNGNHSVFVILPGIPVSVASWWLNLFTPKKHAKVGRVMVESLGNPMVVTNERAKKLFPEIKTVKIDEAFV